MSTQATIAWLKAASLLLIGFGVMVALAAVPSLGGPARLLIDLAFWPVDGAQSLDAAEARLLCAVAGGMLVGWGALLYVISARLYEREPALARTMIMISIGSWFIVDSAASIAAGAAMNAVFNIGFLLLFAVPLMTSASDRRDLTTK